MSEASDELLKINERREELLKELNRLEKLKTVKKYLAFKDENEKLKSEEKELCKKVMCEKYASCKHVYITNFTESDDWEGRTYKYHGCVKCGLDSSILSESRNFILRDSEYYKNMKPYFVFGDIDGIDTGIYYENLDYASSIYLELQENNPSMTDEDLIEMFKIIMKKEIEKEHKEKVRKRERKDLDYHQSIWDYP